MGTAKNLAQIDHGLSCGSPTLEGIKRDLAETKKLDNAITLNEFDWSDILLSEEKGQQAPKAVIIVGKYEEWFFTRNGRTSKSETTWNSNSLEVYKRFDDDDRLTQDVVEALIKRTKPNSRSRKRYCQAITKSSSL